jgi:hypothetical protein
LGKILKKENFLMETLIPDVNGLKDDDKFGFIIFVKALHAMLRMDEGICIEDMGHKFLVHKFKDEETNEELVGIQFDPDFGDQSDKIINGTIVWCDLDKSPEERHKDNE